MKNILLVEDTPMDARVFLHFFGLVDEASEYKVTWVRSPLEADTFLLSSDAILPDFIILDIGFNGYEDSGLDYLGKLKTNIKYVKRKIHLIPVMLLTAANGEDEVNLAYRKRANAYFVKPVEGNGDDYGYESLIRSLLDFWRKSKLPILTAV
jgi:CheY-like chemotaxis protein